MKLFHPFPAPLAALYSTIDGGAKADFPVFPGSAGSISTRKNQHGLEYLVRRYYAGDGTQKEEYLGLTTEAAGKAHELSVRIDEVKAAVSDIRLLIREGFQAADAKTYATLAGLHLNGLFVAGATLVGSHAFGVLLNQMGARAGAYATEDVDVARRESLAFKTMPKKSFLEMLRDSGIDFVDVPSLKRRHGPSSFKQRGKSRFHVDLLVPSSDDEIHVMAVPELRAHATALPYLAYLLGETQTATLLSREGCCPVRIPVPERFALHKLIVSQLRRSEQGKSSKDIQQAAVMLAVLGELFPAAIEKGFKDLPRSARSHARKAVPLAIRLMQSHPRAVEELQQVFKA